MALHMSRQQVLELAAEWVAKSQAEVSHRRRVRSRRETAAIIDEEVRAQQLNWDAFLHKLEPRLQRCSAFQRVQ
eukprot:5108041-Prymnesium_polylepis.1